MSVRLDLTHAALQNAVIWANRLLASGGFDSDDVDAVTILDSVIDDGETDHWISQVVLFIRMMTTILSGEFVLDDPTDITEF